MEIKEKHIMVVGRREPHERKPGFYEGYGYDKYLRELPNTPFWEGDRVRVEDQDLFVAYIDYPTLGKLLEDGSRYPSYHVNPDFYGGGYMPVSEDRLELTGRGNIWKRAHGQPLEFIDVMEEGAFFWMQGEAEEVRHPIKGYSTWTIKEALVAIKKGEFHGIQPVRFNPSAYTALRYNNPDLGARLGIAIIDYFE